MRYPIVVGQWYTTNRYMKNANYWTDSHPGQDVPAGEHFVVAAVDCHKGNTAIPLWASIIHMSGRKGQVSASWMYSFMAPMK